MHRFLDGGFEALADAPRPGRPPRWKREDLDALEDMLDASATEGRIRTLPALAEWLRRERGVDLDSSWLSVLLQRDGFRWKRTRDSIRHQADPALQAAAWERLEGLRLYGWGPKPVWRICTTWTSAGSRRPCPPATPGPAPGHGWW